MEKVSIVGAGNVGKVLGSMLKSKGYEIVSAVSRSEESRQKASALFQCPVYAEPEKAVRGADMVLITTPDRIIEEICNTIAQNGAFGRGQVVLHCSGAHSSDILRAAREQGAAVLSFHPLQTFPDLEAGLKALPGTFFTVEGDDEALPFAGRLVEALEGKMLSIPSSLKPLYHAAACVACNYLVSLMDMALKMFASMDIPQEKAFTALSPLIMGTLKNISAMGPEKALTGPIARGDLSTVSSHLDKLSVEAPALLPFYKNLGLYTAELALRKGTLEKEQEEKMKALLKEE